MWFGWRSGRPEVEGRGVLVLYLRPEMCFDAIYDLEKEATGFRLLNCGGAEGGMTDTTISVLQFSLGI